MNSESFEAGSNRVDGRSDLPAYTFWNDPDTGFYLRDDGQLGIAVAGVDVGRFTSKGLTQVVAAFHNLGLTDITTAGAATYTAAQLLGGLITRDPAGAGRTDTTDTAAAILALMPGAEVGDTFITYLVNTADAAEAITIAGGTGVTVSNAGNTVLQNESAILLFRKTGAAAMAVYIIGG